MERRHASRRALGICVFAALIAAMPARAGVIGWTPWVQFALAGAHPGQSAIVAEQIRLNLDCGLCTAYYDYDFRVQNTSLFNPIAPANSVIDGFALGVGAGAFGGLALQYASALGGGDGIYPNVGALVNNGIGFMGVNFVPGGFVYATSNTAALGWGMQEYDDRAGPPLPITTYVLRFYSPAQGVGNGIGIGGVGRFDLYSVFGPVPGTGGIDPLGSGDFFYFDENGVGNNFSGALDTGSLTVCSGGGCTGGVPDAPAGFSDVPEPLSFGLMGGGLLALGCWRSLKARRR